MQHVDHVYSLSCVDSARYPAAHAYDLNKTRLVLYDRVIVEECACGIANPPPPWEGEFDVRSTYQLPCHRTSCFVGSPNATIFPQKSKYCWSARLATIIQDCLNQVGVDLPASGSKTREAPPYLLLLMKTSKSEDAVPTGEARRVLGRIELHIGRLSAGDERVTGRGDGIMWPNKWDRERGGL